MKKVIQFLSLAICGLLLSSFVPSNANKKMYDPKYYVAYASENYANGKRSTYVITNVVYVSCDHSHTGTTVTNQLYTYYNAYHKKSRNSISLGTGNNTFAFEFDSRSQAESKRRELIARFNKDNDALLLEKFSVLCDD